MRLKNGKNPGSSAGTINGLSIRNVNLYQVIGYDGEKKTKGRRRHIIVDTLGLILAILVHSATTHDSKSAEPVFKELKNKYLYGIIKIFADGGYRGELIETVRLKFGWIILEVVKRNEIGKFKILLKTWIIECTFKCISFQRTTFKDYEWLTEASVAFVQLLKI